MSSGNRGKPGKSLKKVPCIGKIMEFKKKLNNHGKIMEFGEIKIDETMSSLKTSCQTLKTCVSDS